MLDPTHVLIACKSLDNPATATDPCIARCCAAFVATFRAVLTAAGNDHPNEGGYEAKTAAVAAYLAALPPLNGAENIREFIACVSHGMALEIINGRDGTRLLYAAQIAGAFMEKPAKAAVSALRTPKSTTA
ncbi:MAG TPA: hypothetical protein VG893_11200 [Terracidiphilus sp.]|nr:hypothetical protein [Terracidiphilus sp.]